MVCQPTPSPGGIRRQRANSTINGFQCRGNLFSIAAKPGKSKIIAGIFLSAQQGRSRTTQKGVKIGLGIDGAPIIGQCKVIELRSCLKRRYFAE